jgi:uncharacterized protein
LPATLALTDQTMKYFIIGSLIALSAIACKRRATGEAASPATGRHAVFSRQVNDSFHVFVSLPRSYYLEARRYPLVIVTDGNLYFDAIAAALHSYAAAGAMPEVIVAGFGYRDFATMDSLRARDLTWPVADPEYEMTASGGALNTVNFLVNDLIRFLSGKYKVMPGQTVLAGHSLGGYFTLLAMAEQETRSDTTFAGFVAASPSVHYNDFYILRRLDSLNANGRSTSRVYVCIESDPDSDIAVPSGSLQKQVLQALRGRRLKVETLSPYTHMETAIPGMLKGLFYVLGEETKSRDEK